ncbi:MAG: hypothetical protein EOP94_00375 [Zymomonas sp.]|nr:MAG: hypothetical protein EOP94_00375 [Zymomonas sp.]
MKHDSQRDDTAIDANVVAAAILDAPGWAQVGITVRDERMRLKAAQELAQTIVKQINPRPQSDPRQLALFR